MITDIDRIVFPKHLFRLYQHETYLPHEMVEQEHAEVFINSEGELFVEKSSMIYDAYSLMNHTGRFTTKRAVAFEQLPELIKESDDVKANSYIGMDQENWKNYFVSAD